MDDEDNILVVWEQKLPISGSGSYDWEIHGKCVENDLSTVVLDEFTCGLGGETSTIQSKPDVVWIGTTLNIPKFMVAYLQADGSVSENGIFMRRIQPKGVTKFSDPKAVQLNTATIYGDEPELAKTGDYFVCAFTFADNTGSPPKPYSVRSKQYDSPLAYDLPSGWEDPIEVTETDVFTSISSHVGVAGRPDDFYDIVFAAEVNGDRYIYVGLCEIEEDTTIVENWSVDDDATFDHPAVAIAPDFTVENPDQYDVNRRLVVWQTDNDENGFGIWARFDPEHCPYESQKRIGKRKESENDGDLPVGFVLDKAYPNPFNAAVIIPFTLPESGEVTITLFNLLGQQVFRTNQLFTAGRKYFEFEASIQGENLVSGMYFLQVRFNDQERTQKVILLK